MRDAWNDDLFDSSLHSLPHLFCHVPAKHCGDCGGWSRLQRCLVAQPRYFVTKPGQASRDMIREFNLTQACQRRVGAGAGLCAANLHSNQVNTFKSLQQTLKVGFDERSVSDSHRAAAQRPLARGTPRVAHINHPPTKAIQSWSVVTYLDPYFLNSPGKAISSWFVVPGCSKRKGMQLTWWGSGILVSAAKRCCPPVGWAQHAQVKCSQCQWAKPLIAHYTNSLITNGFFHS